jgi:SAM-dependent methyltransferase
VSDPVGRDEYERLHAALDDENLDAIAGIAGCVPAIGRLNYLDDATLSLLIERMSIVRGARVLDLGCGRGFLGRWLWAGGHRVAYAAVDYAPSALAAVARGVPGAELFETDLVALSDGPYDAVFAIESVTIVDEALAIRLRAAMAPLGRLAISISSIDPSHDRRVRETVDSLRAQRFDVQYVRFSKAHAETVGRLCAALLIEPPREAWARERLSSEAARVLAALRDGTFRSELLVATALT